MRTLSKGFFIKTLRLCVEWIIVRKFGGPKPWSSNRKQGDAETGRSISKFQNKFMKWHTINEEDKGKGLKMPNWAGKMSSTDGDWIQSNTFFERIWKLRKVLKKPGDKYVDQHGIGTIVSSRIFTRADDPWKDWNQGRLENLKKVYKWSVQYENGRGRCTVNPREMPRSEVDYLIV